MDFEQDVDDSEDADEGFAEQNPHYAMYPISNNGWIYIVADTRDMGICKIGLTTKKTPEQRLSEGKTYNPFIVLFATYNLSKTTYGISKIELNHIESYIHRRSFAEPLLYPYTGRSSEWFYMHPEKAEDRIDQLIVKRGFSVERRYLYSFYEGEHAHEGVYISRMRKIKKIYRPLPAEFECMARRYRIPYKHYEHYLEYLKTYHAQENKIYL